MITKIQSYTDVITNSSSTVFVMHEEDANYYNKLKTDGCVYIRPIDYDWVLNEGIDAAEMVCNLLDEDISKISTFHEGEWYSYWKTPDDDVWEYFCESHKEQIEEVFEDLYWVDIEDHFEGAWEVTENAIDDSVWYESRH